MLIFGGTTEGRRLARALSAMGHQVWVSVATPLGAEELAGLEDVSVLVGRRSGGEMDALLSRGFHRCVDATHPYAVQATREIGAACARAGVPLRRLLRPEGGEEGLRVDSPEEAARLLAGREGNILLATGAKELPAFAALAAGVELVVIRRPRDRGEGLEDILAWFQADKEEAEWK